MSVFNYSCSSVSSAMSDHSESSLEDSPIQAPIIPLTQDNNICRDYLRNACRRGAGCRYKHPPGLGGVQAGLENVVFCRDYQNSVCGRAACRFIHCTREQEDLYRRTGQLSFDDLLSVPSDPPVCIDYMKGECRRAARCKYRHVIDPELQTSMPVADVDRQKSLKMAAIEAAMIFEETGNAKRRRTMGHESYTRVAPAPTAVVAYSDYQLLEEENRALHQKLDELRRHITVLVATNELLLEQNARYRTTCNVIAAVPTPIVGVSQVLTSTITPAVRTQVHHSGPHGITTMATPAHREIIVQQPATAALVCSAGPAGAAGATGPAEPAGAASGVSVAIVPMTIAVDGPTLGAAAVQTLAPPPPPQIAGAPPPPPPPQTLAPPPPPPQITAQNMSVAAAASLVPITRASIVAANMDVTSINLAAAPLSVASMVLSAPPIPSNLGTGAVDQPTISAAGFGGSSMATMIGPALSLTNIASCSIAPQTPLNLQNSNIVTYPIISHTQLPSSSLV